MGVGRFAFTPLFPLMQKDAALSVSSGAALAAANYLGYLSGALIALGATRRPVTLIRVALVANAAATLGMGLTQQLAWWLVFRAVSGIASAFLLVFISALSLQRLAALDRPMLRAVIFSGVGAGIFAVGALCLGCDYFGASASETWIALGLLSLVPSAFVWRAFDVCDDRATGQRRMEEMTRQAGARWPLIACYGLFGFGYIIPATFLPVMAKAVVGSGWTFGLTWPAFGLAAFASTFVAARASRIASDTTVWRIAQIVMALGVALPAIAAGLAPLMLAAIGVGGTFMVVTMNGMQIAKRVGAANPEKLMAAMTAAFAAGQLAGPLAASWIVEPHAGFSKILLIAAAALLAGVALLAGQNGEAAATARDSRSRKVHVT